METKLRTTGPLKLKDLAARYNISTKTMKRWIKRHEAEIGKAYGHFYMPSQVRKIVEIHGEFEEDGDGDTG